MVVVSLQEVGRTHYCQLCVCMGGSSPVVGGQLSAWLWPSTSHVGLQHVGSRIDSVCRQGEWHDGVLRGLWVGCILTPSTYISHGRRGRPFCQTVGQEIKSRRTSCWRGIRVIVNQSRERETEALQTSRYLPRRNQIRDAFRRRSFMLAAFGQQITGL